MNRRRQKIFYLRQACWLTTFYAALTACSPSKIADPRMTYESITNNVSYRLSARVSTDSSTVKLMLESFGGSQRDSLLGRTHFEGKCPVFSITEWMCERSQSQTYSSDSTVVTEVTIIGQPQRVDYRIITNAYPYLYTSEQDRLRDSTSWSLTLQLSPKQQ